jgi:membrane protein
VESFARLRARHEWLDHLVRAGTRYTERHGDHYAGAITYFSVLSLVPLLMIGTSVAGFVLASQPALLQELREGITSAAPGGIGEMLNGVINSAVEQAGAVGAFGLLGALYSGVGWMSSLREALSEQWGQVPEPPMIVKRLIFDLLTLLGLGLAIAGSFAISGLGSGFAASVLEFLGLADEAWARVLLGVLGFLLGLFANWLIFLWVIARLPREHATFRSAARAALMGALGFEVLKQVMIIYLASVTGSATGKIFGPFIGLLVFVFFASRFVLFVTAWAATSRENERELPARVPGPAIIRPEVTVRSGPTGGVAAGLVGAGVLAGLLLPRLRTRRR